LYEIKKYAETKASDGQKLLRDKKRKKRKKLRAATAALRFKF
jgi:hypothetical protein